MKKFFLVLVVFMLGVGVGFYANKYKDFFLVDQLNQEIEKQPSAAGVSDSFKQFDGSQFKETHAWLGDKIVIVYESELLGSADNYSRVPVEAQVKKALKKYVGAERLILSIQSWSIITNNTLDPKAGTHADWYMQVLGWARDVLPDTNLGFFGMPNSVWNALENPSVLMPEYSKGVNLLWPIMAASDSLYPFFDVPGVDSVRQQKMVETLTAIAKTLSKPFYPLMWHKGSGSTILNQILSDGIIQQQCKFVRENADGLVWWSGANETWNGGVWYPAASECYR